jgi:serine protease inhibitor
MANDLSILLALQNIRFQMTEKGVVLQSEARMEIGCAAEPQLPPAHVMIFDKPFLLMMARAKSKRPYFACWIANPELLVKPSSKSP